MQLSAALPSLLARWGQMLPRRRDNTTPPPDYERIFNEPPSYWDTFQRGPQVEILEMSQLSHRRDTIGDTIEEERRPRTRLNLSETLLLQDLEAQTSSTEMLPPYHQAPSYAQAAQAHISAHPRLLIIGLLLLSAVGIWLGSTVGDKSRNPNFLNDYAELD